MRTQNFLPVMRIVVRLTVLLMAMIASVAGAPQLDPNQKLTVTIDVAGGDLLSKPNEPYRVRPDVRVNVMAKNESSDRLKVIVTDPYAQNRPKLLRGGKVVPYRAEVNKLVRAKDTSPDWFQIGRTDFITVQPYASAKIDVLDLNDWYGALPPGSYQLTNRYRFRAGAPWSNETKPIYFEVVEEKKR